VSEGGGGGGSGRGSGGGGRGRERGRIFPAMDQNDRKDLYNVNLGPML
jgi:hypothetical protein